MEDKDYRKLERRLLILEEMIAQIYDATAKEKKVCPICKQEVRLFVPAGVKLRRNAQCPVCKTLERHRFIWLYLERFTDVFTPSPKSVLHFAPEKGFYDKFKSIEEIDYTPVDFNPDHPRSIRAVDIQTIPFEDNRFDVIMCNHVLEHIPDDKKAISELFRVLKPGGTAYICVPMKRGLETTYEDPSHDTPELRELYYGQDDHLRWYGSDFAELLKAFSVKAISPSDVFTDKEVEEYALLRNEALFADDILFVCTKEVSGIL